jgi:hypothetical protein
MKDGEVIDRIVRGEKPVTKLQHKQSTPAAARAGRHQADLAARLL